MFLIVRGLIGGILLLCSFFDIKYKRVPLVPVVIVFIIEAILLPYRQDIKVIEAIGGLLIGIALLAISKITRGQIGIGDAIIFFVTGVSLGFWINLWLLFISLVIAAIYSAILLLLRRVGRKHRIPFLPFILGGYIGVLLCAI